MLKCAPELKVADFFTTSGHQSVATINVTVTVTAEQRRFELLSKWFHDSETATEQLNPAEALLCVRANVSGFDVDAMDAAALREKLRELNPSGFVRVELGWVPLEEVPSDELAVRLKDTLAIRMPRGDAVDSMCKSLETLVAAKFESHAKDGSLT